MMLRRAMCLCTRTSASTPIFQPRPTNASFLFNRTSNSMTFSSPTTTIQHRFASQQSKPSTIIGGEEPIEAEVVDAQYVEYEERASNNTSSTITQQEEFARPNLFAVVQVGGKQYKVAKGDLISVEKIEAEVDTQIKLQKVLLVGGPDFTAIGRPIIPDSTVSCTVCEQKRAKHVIVFKKKRRQGYKRTRGHRQLQTVLHIDDIQVGKLDNAQNEKVVAVE